MATTTISRDRLSELLDLIGLAGTVELKLTVPDSDIRHTGDRLGLDPLEAEIRQVVFFDTPALDLNTAGLVVRARRIQGGGGDTVVKLRPVTKELLSNGELDTSNLGVEIDAMPGGFVCSASMKGTSTAKDVSRVVKGKDELKSILSGPQRDLFNQFAPDGLKLKDLIALGPINVLKLKFKPVGFTGKMVAELWLYPDGTRIFELSTKCPPGETIAVTTEARRYLEAHGVDLTAEQAPKTKRALEYFSRTHLEEIAAENATGEPAPATTN